MGTFRFAVCFIRVVLLSAAPSSAAIITDLFQIGAGGNRISLPDRASLDPHYEIFSKGDRSIDRSSTFETSTSW